VDLRDLYHHAQKHAEDGQFEEAEALYAQIERDTDDRPLKAMVGNDLGCLAQLRGDTVTARSRYERALEIHADCEPARQNLAQLFAESRCRNLDGDEVGTVRVAILSFLFNWPSTGGGIIHTVELATFLKRAG